MLNGVKHFDKKHKLVFLKELSKLWATFKPRKYGPSNCFTTRKHGIFLLANSKKVPNLNVRKKDHYVILDKLISTCPFVTKVGFY
jgi:hypothetical protein